MTSDEQVPDYELDDVRVVSSPQELRAMAHPLRSGILELLLQRAATVGELAATLDRPRSTVAYHVGVLIDAGMLEVIRTRKVRAIDERFYGRTARVFYVGSIEPEHVSLLSNELVTAAAKSSPAHLADDLRAIIRHARIPRSRAAEFWDRVLALTHEFTQLPRSGTSVHTFVAGLYPTDHPTLPPPDDNRTP